MRISISTVTDVYVLAIHILQRLPTLIIYARISEFVVCASFYYTLTQCRLGIRAASEIS